MSKKLIMSFLLCIALVGCGKTEKVNTSVSDAPDPDYVKNYFENYDPSEHKTTPELKELEFTDTSNYDDWRSLKCSIAGIDIQLPTTLDYLEQHGWSVEKSEDYDQNYYMELSDDYLFDDDGDLILEPGASESTQTFSMYDFNYPDKDSVEIFLTFTNTSTENMKMLDCPISGIYITSFFDYEVDFPQGITSSSTKDDIVKTYSEENLKINQPDKNYDSILQYLWSDRNSGSISFVFLDDRLDNVSLQCYSR